eukprot:2254836-Lingulodinium_polyedra.AAC.1
MGPRLRSLLATGCFSSSRLSTDVGRRCASVNSGPGSTSGPSPKCVLLLASRATEEANFLHALELEEHLMTGT